MAASALHTLVPNRMVLELPPWSAEAALSAFKSGPSLRFPGWRVPTRAGLLFLLPPLVQSSMVGVTCEGFTLLSSLVLCFLS